MPSSFWFNVFVFNLNQKLQKISVLDANRLVDMCWGRMCSFDICDDDVVTVLIRTLPGGIEMCQKMGITVLQGGRGELVS